MVRKKDLLPESEIATWFIPHPNGAELLKSIREDPSKPIEGTFHQTVNCQVVPALRDNWQQAVRGPANAAFSSNDFREIEAVLRRYVVERMARGAKAPSWRVYMTRIERLKKASKALLDELNDQGYDYAPMWRHFSEIAARRGNHPVTHDEIYPLVSSLYSLAFHALKDLKSRGTSRERLSHNAPFRLLVASLAEVWTKAGGPTTVAKSGRGGYAPPSAFAEFVWTVMTTVIPDTLREHAQSEGAMQTAVSDALSDARRVGMISPKRDFE